MRNRVRELREERGVSQTALAEAVGVTKRTIYAIEKENQDLRISLARKLAVFLGCAVDDLFIFEDGAHSTTDKAVWFAHIVRYTSVLMSKQPRDVIKLLDKSGLAQRLIMGYEVWHTQGYEYLAEMLSEELSALEEVA